MGFTPPEAHYILDFTGTELDGLTVTARSTDIGGILELSGLMESMGDVPNPDDVDASKISPEQKTKLVRSMGGMRTLIETYGRVLVSWDLEIPAGRPVPATAEGLARLSPRHVMMIIKAWQAAVSAVPDELGKDSIGGEPSLAGSMPMEPLSAPLAS